MKQNELSFDEYKELKATYQSEGYGIINKLIDAKVGTMFHSLTVSKHTDSETLAIVNEIKGLMSSKEYVYGILREEGEKHEDKKNQ